ncbi:MAG: dihydroorotase [Gammaproteobacteria bacterium]
MIRITGARSIAGKTLDLTIPSQEELDLSGKGLTIFPGLIDPHVHFRTPGMEDKEDWRTAAQAAVRGGYTTVFDMPNTLPPTITAEHLREKKALIDSQLREIGIPLRYELYFGADKNHLSEIHKIKNDVIGIKIFMGCSTGNLVIDDDESLHAAFAIAATQNLIVAVHAEDETLLKERKQKFSGSKKYSDHSLIRNEEVAVRAVEKAIELARIYRTRLYILHVSTHDEIRLIKQAKSEGLTVYAETTPHHIFLNDLSYENLRGKAVVNPPLRSEHHQTEVLKAIRDGIIDTIGSDHAPHLEHEKAYDYGVCPSGMPGIETTLPLLLNAHHQGLITLEKIVELTCTQPREIFGLPENNDVVLVDLEKTQMVSSSHLKTKCKWTPYEGMNLRGWPVFVVFQGHCYML